MAVLPSRGQVVYLTDDVELGGGADLGDGAPSQAAADDGEPGDILQLGPFQTWRQRWQTTSKNASVISRRLRARPLDDLLTQRPQVGGALGVREPEPWSNASLAAVTARTLQADSPDR